MRQKLNKEYGGGQSVTALLYVGAGTSAGDAEVLSHVPKNANAEQRVAGLQEANHVAVQKFLQRLLARLNADGRADESPQQNIPHFILFEGGSGKGIALQHYQEIFGKQLGAVVAVELSDAQYAAQRKFVEEWIQTEEHGFTAENTLFIQDPNQFFEENPGTTYADLTQRYTFILVNGDVQEELQRSQEGNLKYDAAVFIESIIHMDRAQIVEAVMKTLTEGGVFALTDVGVVSALSSISNMIAKLLDNRANVRPNGSEWWEKNYEDSLIAILNKDDDQKATAHQLAQMLLDRKMFSKVIKAFREEGGMSLTQALRQYILDLLLFSSGSPIVTNYDVTLQKNKKEHTKE